MAALAIPKLVQRPDRILAFAAQYKAQSNFELADGLEVGLLYEQKTYNTLIAAAANAGSPGNAEKTKAATTLRTLNFKCSNCKDENIYPLTKFQKTKAFGGQNTGTPSTAPHWGFLGVVAKAKNFALLPPGKTVELQWISKFNTLITKAIGKKFQTTGLTLWIGDKYIENVVGVMGAPGASSDPKADAIFVRHCCGRSKTMSMAGWASLKDGKTAKNFQQWGGLSAFKALDIVKKFAEDVKYKCPKGVPPSWSVGREIPNNTLLKQKAIYGKDWKQLSGTEIRDASQGGADAVNFIIQGNPTNLEWVGAAKNGVVKLITESDHHVYSDSSADVKKSIIGDARPVFMARRDQARQDFGVPKTRMFVYPSGGKPAHTWRWLDKEWTKADKTAAKNNK
jgi:hypothetical protein